MENGDATPTARESEEVLATRLGRLTVAEHLARAVEAGNLIAHGDGTWELPAEPDGRPGDWLRNPVPKPLRCRLLDEFLFDDAYGRSCVPWTCRNCYKVRIVPTTLRQLLAVGDLLEASSYSFKYGLELEVRYTSGIYAAFVYLDGLDRARAAFHTLRPAVDDHPRLGGEVPMQIKRGCTRFEVHCGPSNRWTFAPEAVERWLMARVRVPPPARALPKGMTLLHWAQAAFRIGDETYLDITGGRLLYPKAVTYDPETGLPQGHVE